MRWRISVAILLGIVPIAWAHEPWGILSRSAQKTVVYSLKKIDKGKQLRAYKIDKLSEFTDVTISRAVLKKNSPLCDQDGGAKSWEHIVQNPEAITGGALWLCLPVDWKICSSGGDEIKFINRKGFGGSVRVEKKSEGIEIVIVFKGKTEKAYYSLGYDI